MTHRFLRLIVTLSPIALFLSGCKTFDEGADQEVTVQSFPAGATVMMDGERVGTTPLTLELPRKITHRVVLTKDGYKPVDATIAPTENEKGKDLVRFGLMDEAGLYYDLDPNPLQIQLQPSAIPSSRGPDAYWEMTSIIADVDRMRQQGEISPVEHKYMVQQVIEFYNQ